MVNLDANQNLELAFNILTSWPKNDPKSFLTLQQYLKTKRRYE